MTDGHDSADELDFDMEMASTFLRNTLQVLAEMDPLLGIFISKLQMMVHSAEPKFVRQFMQEHARNHQYMQYGLLSCGPTPTVPDDAAAIASNLLMSLHREEGTLRSLQGFSDIFGWLARIEEPSHCLARTHHLLNDFYKAVHDAPGRNDAILGLPLNSCVQCLYLTPSSGVVKQWDPSRQSFLVEFSDGQSRLCKRDSLYLLVSDSMRLLAAKYQKIMHVLLCTTLPFKEFEFLGRQGWLCFVKRFGAVKAHSDSLIICGRFAEAERLLRTCIRQVTIPHACMYGDLPALASQLEWLVELVERYSDSSTCAPDTFVKSRSVEHEFGLLADMATRLLEGLREGEFTFTMPGVASGATMALVACEYIKARSLARQGLVEQSVKRLTVMMQHVHELRPPFGLWIHFTSLLSHSLGEAINVFKTLLRNIGWQYWGAFSQTDRMPDNDVSDTPWVDIARSVRANLLVVQSGLSKLQSALQHSSKLYDGQRHDFERGGIDSTARGEIQILKTLSLHASTVCSAVRVHVQSLDNVGSRDAARKALRQWAFEMSFFVPCSQAELVRLKRQPRLCEACQAPEPHFGKFAECNQCHAVAFCSKSCQKKLKHDHEKACLPVTPLLFNLMADMQKNRRRHGPGGKDREDSWRTSSYFSGEPTSLRTDGYRSHVPVEVSGLGSATCLNGQVGELIKFDAKLNRWQVEFPTGTKLIKAFNLATPEGFTPSSQAHVAYKPDETGDPQGSDANLDLLNELRKYLEEINSALITPDDPRILEQPFLSTIQRHLQQTLDNAQTWLDFYQESPSKITESCPSRVVSAMQSFIPAEELDCGGVTNTDILWAQSPAVSGNLARNDLVIVRSLQSGNEQPFDRMVVGFSLRCHGRRKCFLEPSLTPLCKEPILGQIPWCRSMGSWTPREWAWLACLLLERLQLNIEFHMLTPAYKLQHCPDTSSNFRTMVIKDFINLARSDRFASHKFVPRDFGFINAGRSMDQFRDPCLVFDQQLWRAAHDIGFSVVDRSLTPAMTYSAPPDNTPVDAKGKAWQSAKDYVMARLRNGTRKLNFSAEESRLKEAFMWDLISLQTVDVPSADEHDWHLEVRHEAVARRKLLDLCSRYSYPLPDAVLSSNRVCCECGVAEGSRHPQSGECVLKLSKCGCNYSKSPLYCGKACRNKHWKQHKRVCFTATTKVAKLKWETSWYRSILRYFTEKGSKHFQIVRDSIESQLVAFEDLVAAASQDVSTSDPGPLTDHKVDFVSDLPMPASRLPTHPSVTDCLLKWMPILQTSIDPFLDTCLAGHREVIQTAGTLNRDAWILTLLHQAQSALLLQMHPDADRRRTAAPTMSRVVMLYEGVLQLDANNTSALKALVEIHLGVPGLKADFVKAANFAERACESGDLDSLADLAKMYSEGTGVPKDPAKAITLLKRGAEQGHASCKTCLGYYYNEGLVVQQDYPYAKALFEEAAAEGNAMACYNLGMMYVHGRADSKDIAKAIFFLEQAAELGNVNAMQKLFAFYTLGEGGPEDASKATKYAKLAAEAGCEWAAKVL